MKTSILRLPAVMVVSVLTGLSFTSLLARADGPAVSVTGVPTDQDTTIMVRKGARPLDPPDYRIDSGSEEITGDPVAGQDGSYESWKKACADWKKDLREMNGKALIALSCGSPRASRDKSMLVTQTSTGTYKLKVRVRDTGGEAAP